MSFTALAWAAKQRTGGLATKAALLALANYADEHGCAYPSTAAIAAFGEMDTKTATAALDRLVAAGLISDTGDRAGHTKQIKIYRLALESQPETEAFQKRKPTASPAKATQKRVTDTVKEPVTPTIPSESTESDAQSARLTPEEFEEGWKALAAELGIPTVRGRLNPARRKHFLARTKEHPPNDWIEAFHRIRQSPFLRGETGNWSGANVDFLLRPNTLNSILEGKYDRAAH